MMYFGIFMYFLIAIPCISIAEEFANATDSSDHVGNSTNKHDHHHHSFMEKSPTNKYMSTIIAVCWAALVIVDIVVYIVKV